MQTKGISLANLKGRLSRAEMKQIMGGDDPGTGTVGDGCKGLKECREVSDCSVAEPDCKSCKNGTCAP